MQYRRAYASGTVTQYIDPHGAWQAGLQFWQSGLDGIDRGNHIGAGLALHVQDDGGNQASAG